jgi:hypothetical protein
MTSLGNQETLLLTETIMKLTVCRKNFFLFLYFYVGLVKGKLSLLYCFVSAPALGNFIFYASIQTK